MNPITLLVAAAQGAHLRRTTERLPPAGGPVTGSMPGPGEATMRILVIGDSTAAGVGVASHSEGFVGALARNVSGAGTAVEWDVIARPGATSRGVHRSLLPQLGTERFDLAVILVGVNDVLARRNVLDWRADVAAIVDRLAELAGQVVMTGIPPFERFPSMPRTLGRYLARHARRLDEAAQALCRDRETVTWVGSADLLPDDPDFFARDGFHPSATGYAIWAEAIWQQLSTDSLPPRTPS